MDRTCLRSSWCPLLLSSKTGTNLCQQSFVNGQYHLALNTASRWQIFAPGSAVFTYWFGRKLALMPWLLSHFPNSLESSVQPLCISSSAFRASCSLLLHGLCHYTCCILTTIIQLHIYIYKYMQKQSIGNERTNTLLYKSISLTLYSQKGDVCCVWEMSWRQGQTAILTQVLLATIAALLPHLGWGCSTVGHWGPKALCLPLALTSASCLQLTQTVCAPGYIIVSLRAQSPLSAAGSHVSILSPTDSNCLCTWLYYCFTEGPKPSVCRWLSLQHLVSNWLKLSVHLVILLFNAHLLPLFFCLFTQPHLLIDGLVEGQYITYL